MALIQRLQRAGITTALPEPGVVCLWLGHRKVVVTETRTRDKRGKPTNVTVKKSEVVQNYASRSNVPYAEMQNGGPMRDGETFWARVTGYKGKGEIGRAHV